MGKGVKMGSVGKIKDWENFQHFKDRNPPWVKLYKYLLDDPDWHALDGDDAKTLVMLWLLASEDKTKKGELPDIRKTSFRLRIEEDVLKQQLTRLKHWVIQDDINTISDRYQTDAPETETETETETEQPAPEILPDDNIPIPLSQEKPKKKAASPPAKAGYLKKITGEQHFSNQVGEYLNSIIKYAGTISTLNNKHPPFNPYKFTQFHIKQKTHPGALMETLEAISKQWDLVQNPWSYGTAVIKTKNGNWYEKEEIKKYQEVEQEWNGILKENPRLSALISEAMKGI